VQAQSTGKILIAYFSWGGNTREIATQIQKQTGGDLFEIKTVKPYPPTLLFSKDLRLAAAWQGVQKTLVQPLTGLTERG
jgi:flavodoxin